MTFTTLSSMSTASGQRFPALDMTSSSRKRTRFSSETNRQRYRLR